MTSGISLEKRAEAAQVSLVKLLKEKQSQGVELGELSAQVIIAIDYSGSMSGRYRNGEVQTAVERSLGLSLSGLDDDGTIQVFFFDHGSYPTETVTAASYQGFVNTWTQGRHMGGTNYTPVMNDIMQFAHANGMMAPGKPPIFVLFVTDGEPGDKKATTDQLVNYAQYPVFWQFLGLGYSPKFLKKLDEMPGRVVDNVGLTEMRNTLNMDDVSFYDEIIREFFGKWLPAARAAGIVQ
jgi:hypothetical protein